MMEGEDNDIRQQYVFINNVDCYASKNIGKFLSMQIPGIPADDYETEDQIGEEKLSEPAGPPLPKKNCYVINGTLSYPQAKKPAFVKDILDYSKKGSFYEHILQHDIIIYDVTGKEQQTEEVLWIAKLLMEAADKFEYQKKFIVISSLMTWTSTKPADPDDPGFLESEYRRRKPHPNYKELFNFEKEIINCGKKHKKKFTTYVLACGVLYGCGEDLFQHFFCEAWMNQTPLPVYFSGLNVLPTIHVLDLANVIQNIADNPPRQRYIVVKDDGANTLAEIIQAISTNLATGDIISLETDDQIKEEEIPITTLERLTMDLRIEASTIKEEMQVRWLCETGMIDNMTKLVAEFIETHNLKPLRLCILGPPSVGKTALAKELCKTYRLHHIHLKAIIFETYKHLMEPIRAMDNLQGMRRTERLAAEAMAAEKFREMEADLIAVEDGEQPLAPPAHLEGPTLNVNESMKTGLGNAYTGIEGGTFETSDYDDYRFTYTADEVPSIRKSTQTETITNLEHYPMGPAPIWKSEDELELLVSDAQEQLDNLRENTDEHGRLNDETLVRLLTQKLLSKQCQNQGFVLDGFPKSIAQAEMLFRPDPDDEEALGDEKHPGFHRLITPQHVIVLEGSNEFTLHRLHQQAEAAGIDPAKARVIPPPWVQGYRTDKLNTLVGLDSIGLRIEGEEELPPAVVDARETDEAVEEDVAPHQEYATFETHLTRFERRLQQYRALMAPAAAATRNKLISEAKRAAEEDRQEEEERQKLMLEAAKERAKETNESQEQSQQNQEDGGHSQQPNEPDAVVNIEDDDRKSVELTVTRAVLDAIYKHSLESRLAEIPPLPETPSETEENVLTYFDIREIHPIRINMDKDFSPASDIGGCREQCLERIKKAIGRPEAVALPVSSAMPRKPQDAERTDQLEERAEKLRLKRLHSAEMRAKHQAAEEEKLLQKQQDDWNDWLSLIKTQDYQCAEARALPMRHYLMRYVMPELTKALVDCSSVRPEDPIDFIAEYLLNCGAQS